MPNTLESQVTAGKQEDEQFPHAQQSNQAPQCLKRELTYQLNHWKTTNQRWDLFDIFLRKGRLRKLP